MKKNRLILVFSFGVALMLSSLSSFAQKENFDIITYSPLTDWTKEVKGTALLFSKIEGSDWCQIILYKNTISNGSLEKDFDQEWKELVIKNYPNISEPIKENPTMFNNWKVVHGTGVWKFKGTPVTTILTTYSGFGACVSIVCNTTNKKFIKRYQNFIAEISLFNGKKENNPIAGKTNSGQNTPTATKGTFKFTTTNFEDGWTSTVQTDWVEVKKANTTVFIHYPKEGTIFPADPEPLTIAAWNILVAPRYNNLTNFKTAYISTYDRPYLGMGSAKENATGKQVYIVLFRQGQSGWIEFVSPDKNSFKQNFKFDPEAIRWDSETDLMKPLAQMTGYNKFAVAESDFTGSWTSDFTGVQQLYHVYTGDYAGMNINQSNEVFEFGAGNSYNWRLLVINGMVGATKYANVKSNGKFTVPNSWQIKFTDIEGKPKLCSAFFSCIKGARLLHLLDAQYPGSGIYTVYGKK